jgi:UDP-2,3-diacylglucosamine pyrophosphatase LpxH
MVTVVVSDLHIGSKYFLDTGFKRFLAKIPTEWTLVLNGDNIDIPGKPPPVHHLEIIERLIERSKSSPVVWITGNHDEKFPLEDSGNNG